MNPWSPPQCRGQSMRTLAFWRSYAVTARPHLLFVSGAAGLAGLALAPEMSWPTFAAAAVVFFLVYGFGQALTDTTQIDTDSLSAPYRPLCRGLVTPRQIAAVSLLGLIGCAVVLVMQNVWTLVPAVAGIAGLSTYTWFKRRWWAGPFYNSWIVALLPVMGVLCAPSSSLAHLASPRVLLATVSVFFSYAVFVVLGYLKDISADRATGYVTLPVRFGWRASVMVSAVLASVALLASALLVASSSTAAASPGAGGLLARAMWVAAAGSLVKAHVQLLQTDRESEAHDGIGWSVRGFVLLHLGLAGSALPVLALPALGVFLLFELLLAGRPERSQI